MLPAFEVPPPLAMVVPAVELPDPADGAPALAAAAPPLPDLFVPIEGLVDRAALAAKPQPQSLPASVVESADAHTAQRSGLRANG